MLKFRRLRRPAQPRLLFYALAYGFLILMLDQYSKWMILNVIMVPAPQHVPVWPWVSFDLVWNHGVTFGMFAARHDTMPYVFGAIAAGIIAMLIHWLWRVEHRLTAAAIGVIIGGAIGNVIDRLRFGAVVDFINVVHYPWVFNVADSAVVIGVVLLIFESWRGERAGA
jgi:signal peptidase II